MKRLLFTIILLQQTLLYADNYSLSFDGTDDYVDITYPISSGTSDITYSIWFKLDNLNSQYIIGSQSSSGDLFELYYNSGNSNFQFMIRNGTYTNVEGGSISPGSWYHASMVRDYDDSLKLYINGNQVAASITLTGSLNPSIRIGVESGSSEYLNGYIDEFAIWDDALTANEISALYNSGSGLSASSNSGNYTSSANLKGYWNFNTGSGTTLTDQTSNGNHGTIYGATWSTDVPTAEELSLYDNIIIPSQHTLHQNYPNPFNPVTTLGYDLPENSRVNIIIYDMLGRQVKTLINQTQDAGYKSVIWDATNDYGKPVSAGIYLYQIQAGEYMQTKKMVLLK